MQTLAGGRRAIIGREVWDGAAYSDDSQFLIATITGAAPVAIRSLRGSYHWFFRLPEHQGTFEWISGLAATKPDGIQITVL